VQFCVAMGSGIAVALLFDRATGRSAIQGCRRPLAAVFLASVACAIAGPLAWPDYVAGAALVWVGPLLVGIAALLVAWAERNGVAVVGQADGDPGAVVFDAIQSARARGIDVVIADTAGRLPTQLHLMEEIKKVRRVAAKALADAPHEVLLVLDANTGQNALAQVKAFDAAIGLSGLVLTKLDGSAKGGVVAAIARARASDAKPLPLLFVGVGEGIDDLRPFSARDFVEGLVD